MVSSVRSCAFLNFCAKTYIVWKVPITLNHFLSSSVLTRSLSLHTPTIHGKYQRQVVVLVLVLSATLFNNALLFIQLFIVVRLMSETFCYKS